MSSPKDKMRIYYSLYEDKEQLCLQRYNANMKYIKSLKNPSNISKYLTPEEELTIVQAYELKMRDFLQGFRPRNESLPTVIKGISFHYLKRFYLVSSVMDYHPKDVMFACVFLSCKNFEYNVPLDVFIQNIGGEPKLMKNIILGCEEALLCRLNFLLNIHTPHKPIEQYINQLEADGDLRNPKMLYEHVNHFLSHMWFTDACLLFPPHKIGLAAIMHAADSTRQNVDNFIATHLLQNCHREHLDKVVNTIRNECSEIRAIVTKERRVVNKRELKTLKMKLENCLNPRNNTASDIYKTLLAGKGEELDTV